MKKTNHLARNTSTTSWCDLSNSKPFVCQSLFCSCPYVGLCLHFNCSTGCFHLHLMNFSVLIKYIHPTIHSCTHLRTQCDPPMMYKIHRTRQFNFLPWTIALVTFMTQQLCQVADRPKTVPHTISQNVRSFMCECVRLYTAADSSANETFWPNPRYHTNIGYIHLGRSKTILCLG